MGVKTTIGAELEPSTVEGIVTDAKHIIDRAHNNKMQDQINEELYQQINNILARLTEINVSVLPTDINIGQQSTITITADCSSVANSIIVYRDNVQIYTDDTPNTHWQYQDVILPEQTGTITYKVQISISGTTVTKEALVNVNKISTNIQWSLDSVTANIGELNIFPTLQNADGLQISYSSSNENVATIDDNGQVTLVDVGTAIITATFNGDATRELSSDSYTLNVQQQIHPIYKTVIVGCGTGDWNDIIISRDTNRQLVNNMVENIAINVDGSYIFIIVDSLQTVDNLYTCAGEDVGSLEFPIQLQDRGVHDGYRYYRSVSKYNESNYQYKINKT